MVTIGGYGEGAVLPVTKSRITAAAAPISDKCDLRHSQSGFVGQRSRCETPVKSPRGVVPYSAEREGIAVMPHATVPSFRLLNMVFVHFQPDPRSCMLRLKK